MTLRETTLAKLQKLPEPLLQEVSNFIDFVEMKHTLPIEGDESENVSERWAKWFEGVDRLEVAPIDPVNDYQDGLLSKYRQQGLEL
jgi:hypothetical protein